MLAVEEVKKIATLVAMRFPEEIREDVYSAAVEGALTAVRRYNPQKGDIEAYAFSYAKGYAFKEWHRLKSGHLSLNYTYEDKDGDEVRLEEFVGDEDNGYGEVEVRLFVSELAQDEEDRKILSLLLDGASQSECARALGKPRAWVNYRLRRLKEKAERLLTGEVERF